MVRSVVAADLTVATTPEAGAHPAPASDPAVRPGLPEAVDIAIIGAGCSGLATAVRLAELADAPSVVVLEGRSTPDPRSWCSWDDGSDPMPEARSASWDRWEVRTGHGTSTGTDPLHPYVLVRASDRRAAAEARTGAGTSVRIVPAAVVRSVSGGRSTDEPGRPGTRSGGAPAAGALVRSTAGTVVAGTVLDARGPRCPDDVPPGRVLLHQRFVGHWIRTTAPVFDTATVTLMDFVGQRQDGHVAFVYVLPVSPTSALVESTVFTVDGDDPLDHRAAIAAYVRRRWGLDDSAWSVVEEESGCIPMTDAPPTALATRPSTPTGPVRTEVVVGTTRPSSGYGFARSNRHSVTVAEHLARGTSVPRFRDRPRTALLDAVFLRFLRDRPDLAPGVFQRLFALPGPLVVRFLTERSGVLDDLRIVLALPKVPFLVALGVLLVERRPRRRPRRGPRSAP
ncbi:lycopene cyclase family protein [Curtobacterium luteum]|uniref:lycopene cyclase family protein n=1 Tax=Curtobacterium luteum TaxID=33881 RepID=UPI0037F26EB5